MFVNHYWFECVIHNFDPYVPQLQVNLKSYQWLTIVHHKTDTVFFWEVLSHKVSSENQNDYFDYLGGTFGFSHKEDFKLSDSALSNS